MKRVLFVVSLFLAVGLLAAPAQTDLLAYSNGFEGAVGTEWSHTSTDVTPIGARRFLGQFGNDNVVLSLNGLPSHSDATISFDLFLIMTWDGNGPLNGPDIWSLKADGSDVIRTTFTNYPEVDPGYTHWQAYPDAYPGGQHPGRTGATENNTLGYTWYDPRAGGVFAIDSVYSLSFTVPHSAESLSFAFAASLTDTYPAINETWGLDNVRVRLTPAVPEPASLLLALGGLGTLISLRRRK